MRHRVKRHLKLNHKPGAHTDSVIRNLLTSFFLHKSLVTTHKRAKAISGKIDRLIVDVKKKDTKNAIREAMSILYTEASSKELFSVAEKSGERNSGFTRITPIKYRDGDSAKLVQIELV